jgi:hypothetical protein
MNMNKTASTKVAANTPNASCDGPGADPLTMTDKLMLHPLYSKTGALPTLPINEVYLGVKMAILLNECGYVFTGRSGIGKTRAIAMVKSMLQAEFPRLCMFSHDALNHQSPSVRGFFKHFLHTAGHIEQRGETYDLRARVSNTLIDEAKMSGLNRVVMFIDEASALLLTDFLYLKDVYNDLDDEGVQLLTVLMGQSPDMENVIANLRTKKRQDLINRFATRVLPIRAYDRLEDLGLILRGIDRSFYPENSTQSWTAFFLPKACSAGFRLENEAEPFFRAIGKGISGQQGRVVFPARATFLAIRRYLLNMSSYDSETFQPPVEGWASAVEYARLHDAMKELDAKTRTKPTTPKKKTAPAKKSV